MLMVLGLKMQLPAFGGMADVEEQPRSVQRVKVEERVARERRGKAEAGWGPVVVRRTRRAAERNPFAMVISESCGLC